jgi:hypothetical protein
MARFRLIMYIAGGANRDPRAWRAALVVTVSQVGAAMNRSSFRWRVVGNGNNFPQQYACRGRECLGGGVGDMLARICVLMQRASRSRLGSHGSRGAMGRSIGTCKGMSSLSCCNGVCLGALDIQSEWGVC